MATGLMIGLGTLAGKAASELIKNTKKNTQASVPQNTPMRQTEPAAVQQSTPQVFSGNTTSIPNNGAGVRSALNDMGYDNSRISWDGANVTVDGQKFMTPDSVVDGTSYADKSKIYRAAAEKVKSEGDSLQAATDFVAGKGVSNGVQYLGNGMISVFGQQVKPMYITDDGKAIVRTSDLESIYSGWKENSGYMTGADVFNQTQDKYGSMIDSALNDVLNREAWEYDLENDEAFRAYRDMYTREGNRAMEDAVAGMSGQTGGYVNSAALTAGGQAQNYYMQQLADRIPELQANDYNRYLGEQELRRQALNSVLGVSDNYYNQLYTTSQADRAAINNAFDTNYNRNVTERQWQDAHAQNLQQQALNDYALQQAAAESKYYDDNARYASESMNLSNQAATQNIQLNQINMQQAQIENAFANGRARGFFTADEAAVLGVSVNTDPYAAEQRYTALMNQLEIDKQTTLQAAALQNDLALQAAKAQATAASKPKLTASQAKKAYDDGVRTDEVVSAYEYYYGDTEAESTSVAEGAAVSANEYGILYNALSDYAGKYNYTVQTIPKESAIAFIMKQNVSEETKDKFLTDLGVTTDQIQAVYNEMVSRDGKRG